MHIICAQGDEVRPVTPNHQARSLERGARYHAKLSGRGSIVEVDPFSRLDIDVGYLGGSCIGAWSGE